MPNTTTHISTSGGLFTQAFVENIRELNASLPGLEASSFSLSWEDAPKGAGDLESTVAAVWELLMERWDAIRNEFEDMDTSQVRDRWLRPLFDMLGFQPQFQRGDTVVDGDDDLRFALSHRGWAGDGAPVLHMLTPSQDLDDRVGTGRGMKTKSPHDMLQVFLNVSATDLWAVLTNGRLLRLQRDYHHTFSKGYVQFDLEAIFETRNYGDFRALYRMCHASRFLPTDEDEDALCPLERFYKTALATGIRVGEDLRGQVREAIELLGNGLLDPELIPRLQEDTEACHAYYGEILRVVYRVLFLLFAEQRGLIPAPGSELEDLYRQTYSLTALRQRAEGDIPRRDMFSDLWEGLQVTFRMVEKGEPTLGVFGYNGELFDTERDVLIRGHACDNSSLLRAIRALTLIERQGVLQRISYLDLGVEELGSIYESLLDFTPRVTTHAEKVEEREVPANTFFLDPRGLERKQTGSYYTHPSLVNELIKSALLPVMRDHLEAAGLPVVEADALGEVTTGLLTNYADLTDAERQTGEKALLAITVCDPAVGSGHFLVKANNVLGAELARIRTGDDYPAEAQVQAAKRDVLAHCIYAVDVNPMAVELCKVSLWINASVKDRPLNFLDHHIKRGNSLIGATPELIKEGVPVEAFPTGGKSRPGDDGKISQAFRDKNRQEREQVEQGGLQLEAFQVTAILETMDDVVRWQELNQLAETQPSVARERYVAYQTSDEVRKAKLEADLWTAAFFWPMPEGTDWAPTYGELFRLQREGSGVLPDEQLEQVARLADRHRFFHWHLEFPQVFADGGFDVVLGNPPWERIKLQEPEFFADKDPEIAQAASNKRKKLIKKLPEKNLALFQAYQEALHFSNALSTFLRESGRFPLSAVGDINTYQVFAGLVRHVVGRRGRVGIIVPSGIATDYYNQDYFNAIVERRELVSLYDFENRKYLFPEVAPVTKFCLLTLTGTGAPEQTIDFAFFLTLPEQLADKDRHFTLTRAELFSMNPNTGTCPTFHSKRDAELSKKLYAAAPVLISEVTGQNPWGVSFQRMFDMSNDSNLFHKREELEAERFALQGNRFMRNDEMYLPLYEAKFIHQYDHRNGTFDGIDKENRYKVRAGTKTPSRKEKARADFEILPRYWVPNNSVIESEFGTWDRGWFVGFKDIVRPASDSRCAVFTVLPEVGVGHPCPLILPNIESRPRMLGILSCLNSFVIDFVARQKIGGSHLTYFIIKQLPVLPPDRYTPALLHFIVPRVLELTYTAWDLAAFADDIWHDADDTLRDAIKAQWQANADTTGGGHAGKQPPDWVEHSDMAEEPFPHPPFMWDEERRRYLRAELDALYGHLYGLTHDELDYILETFPIVKRKDIAEFGDYRTKKLVLHCFDQMQKAIDEDSAYASILNLPPVRLGKIRPAKDETEEVTS